MCPLARVAPTRPWLQPAPSALPRPPAPLLLVTLPPSLPPCPPRASRRAAKEGTRSAAKAFDRWFGTPKLVRETSRKPLLGRGAAPVEKSVDQVKRDFSDIVLEPGLQASAAFLRFSLLLPVFPSPFNPPLRLHPVPVFAPPLLAGRQRALCARMRRPVARLLAVIAGVGPMLAWDPQPSILQTSYQWH